MGAQERYKKIVMDGDAIGRWMADTFIAAHEAAPEEIVSTPTAPGPYSSGTLPRMPDHRMLDLVAWIIPKDALSSCFSTQGIT